EEVPDGTGKLQARARVVEHGVPGRGADARRPSEGESEGPTILALGLDEASAKVRSGPPTDDEADLSFPVWAGLVPLELAPRRPVADEGVAEPVPPYVEDYTRPRPRA